MIKNSVDLTDRLFLNRYSMAKNKLSSEQHAALFSALQARFEKNMKRHSPKGRRSICYDGEALESRKEHKPQNSVIDMAAMGIGILTEKEYRAATT